MERNKIIKRYKGAVKKLRSLSGGDLRKLPGISRKLLVESVLRRFE